MVDAPLPYLSKMPTQQDRMEMAKSIIEDPISYKICIVCEAIVDRECDCCPACSAYKFNSNSEDVVNRAIDIAAKPQTAIAHQSIYKD